MKKKIVSMLTCMIMVSVSLVGCGSSSSTSTTTTTAASSSAEKSKEETAEAVETEATETAEEWTPEKNIRVIIPFNAGGSSDVACRVLTEYCCC